MIRMFLAYQAFFSAHALFFVYPLCEWAVSKLPLFQIALHIRMVQLYTWRNIAIHKQQHQQSS